MSNVPVLFLVFNRPGTTLQVFETIRQAKPSRLYVAADGPRFDHPGEFERCAEVRRIATEVDWPCEVNTLFRDKNYGCRLAVSGALDWFFAAEEYGIVLEDDCLPGPLWFPFAEEMLDRYKYDERVMCVSGNHFHSAAHNPIHSYYFSIYNHCWGWASWRRAWKHFDHEMANWPALKNTSWLLRIGNGSRSFQRYWTNIFTVAYEGSKVDSWAYRWTFSCWAQDGLTILPAKNLVINIGVGVDATHTASANTVEQTLAIEELSFPLTHPQVLVCDVDADMWEFFNLYKPGIIKRILRKMLQIYKYIYTKLVIDNT